MHPSDKPKFVTTLVGLAAIKNRELTDEAIDLWWLSMASWSIEDFTTAAAHLITACQFMPSPYDFAQLRKAGELTSGEAWLDVINGRSLEPGSRAARAAAIVGGQFAVRHADLERDVPHIQRRFMQVYDELTDVDVVRDAVPQLAYRPPADGLLMDFGGRR
jgi:hypothetical protein